MVILKILLQLLKRAHYKILNCTQYFIHHLFHDHKLNSKTDFDDCYTVSILDISSPKGLDVKEHKFIHLMNSLTPFGLNLSNPFALPLLYR